MTGCTGVTGERDQIAAYSAETVRADRNLRRLSQALARMALDLAEARRRVNVLERENANLRARLDSLEALPPAALAG